jgi:hypothetical protein
MNGYISDVSALGKNKVAKARCDINNLLDSSVCQTHAGCQVENAEMFK